MRVRLVVLMGAMLQSAAGCAPREQTPAPVRWGDAVVAGLGVGSDSAAVRRALGRPDSIAVSANPYDARGTLADWWYRQVRVAFNPPDLIAGLWLLERGPRTARGLQVGDPRDDVRRLYGAPPDSSGVEDAWVYSDSTQPLLLVKVWFRRDQVRLVFLGSTQH